MAFLKLRSKQTRHSLIRNFVGLYFLLISLLIIGNPFDGKQFFLLDMPWSNHFQVSDFGLTLRDFAQPIYIVFAIFSGIIGGAIVQKLFFLALIFSSAVTAYQLTKWTTKSQLLSCLIGSTYVLNPVIANRLVTGQWKLLLGYSLLPYVLLQLIKISEQKATKDKYQIKHLHKKFIISYAVLFIFSLHIWYMLSCCLVVFYIYQLITSQKLRHSLKSKLNIWKIVGLIIIFISLLAYGAYVTKNVAPDFDSFTLKKPFIELLNLLLSLRLFWFDYNTAYHSFIWLTIIATLSLVVYGMFIKHRHRLVLILGAYLFVLILALGNATVISQLVTSVVSKLPGYIGLRETTKWLIIINLFNLYYLPIGLRRIIQKLDKSRMKQIAVVSSMVLILLSSNLFILRQVSGQMTNSIYPASWYQVQKEITTKKLRKSLVLPYQNYTKLNFLKDGIVANPAAFFFDNEIIVGTWTNNPRLDRSDELSKLLVQSNNQNCQDLRTYLFNNQIDSIIIINNNFYDGLMQCIGFQAIYNSPTISLYARK